MSEKNLCARDLSVLDLLFDQAQCEKTADGIVTPVNDEVDVKDAEEEMSEDVLRSKGLELEGVKLTEAGKMDEALEKFNEAIEIAQHRPSPYNNRAQLYRFLERDDCKSSIFSCKC